MSQNSKIQATPVHRSRWVIVSASVVLLVLAATAGHARRINLPISVRITAYVNAKPEGVNPEYEWVVSHRRDEIRLYIQRLFVKTGDASASKVSSAVDPYPVQFQLAGEKGALERLKTAPAGTRVVIDAYLEFAGARMMMLDTVEIAPEPTKAGAPAAKP